MREACGEEYEKIRLALTVIVSETPEAIEFRLSYAEALFDGAIMKQLLITQRHLLGEMLTTTRRTRRSMVT
ncbi:hypothetical protein E1264_20065 [Actinomadura sp. KC216]|uniref:hypothetical protein n=1 Tax=Actinomadura sp. KC216 TaxID=2530370 RepID=UPI001046E280|nr:hypothetical protein [Actinomadura sp. KC216]TDB85773.1 hypothetical protein E1264_20065 [Actinomadura sp. KC216]